MRFRTLTLTAGALATVLVLAGCAPTDGTMPGMDHGPGGMTSTAPSQSAAAFNAADEMFVTMMIPHHQQAIEMAFAVELERRTRRVELQRGPMLVLGLEQAVIAQPQSRTLRLLLPPLRPQRQRVLPPVGQARRAHRAVQRSQRLLRETSPIGVRVNNFVLLLLHATSLQQMHKIDTTHRTVPLRVQIQQSIRTVLSKDSERQNVLTE